MNRILLFAALCYLGLNICAQTAPQLLSYQAVVRNNSGVALPNTPVRIRFTIHSGSATGADVFTETQQVTTDAFGGIALSIGSVSSLQVVNWSTGPMFLQEELDVNNTGSFTDIGTTQFLSVPYALYAEYSKNTDVSNYIGLAQDDSIGMGVMTSSDGYAYAAGQWYSRSLGGTPQKIIATRNNIGIMTTADGYAFSGTSWHSQSLGGTPLKIIGNNGNIGIMTSADGYAYDSGTSQWYSQSLGGTPTAIVASMGLVGIMTSSDGYVYDNHSWHSQTLGGTPQKIIAKGGMVLIFTSSDAYVYDGSTHQWSSQTLGGTPLDYAH